MESELARGVFAAVPALCAGAAAGFLFDVESALGRLTGKKAAAFILDFLFACALAAGLFAVILFASGGVVRSGAFAYAAAGASLYALGPGLFVKKTLSAAERKIGSAVKERSEARAQSREKARAEAAAAKKTKKNTVSSIKSPSIRRMRMLR